MGKQTTTKLNAKSLIKEISTVAGVNTQNAENIFNLFTTTWQANRVGMLTVLESGLVTKRVARKAGPRAAKKVATKTAAPKAAKATKAVATVKTAKKAAPAVTKKAVKLKKSTAESTTNA